MDDGNGLLNCSVGMFGCLPPVLCVTMVFFKVLGFGGVPLVAIACLVIVLVGMMASFAADD